MFYSRRMHRTLPTADDENKSMRDARYNPLPTATRA